jgi:hypothetical protein
MFPLASGFAAGTRRIVAIHAEVMIDWAVDHRSSLGD